jgi:hypothetical protein
MHTSLISSSGAGQTLLVCCADKQTDRIIGSSIVKNMPQYDKEFWMPSTRYKKNSTAGRNRRPLWLGECYTGQSLSTNQALCGQD